MLTLELFQVDDDSRLFISPAISDWHTLAAANIDTVIDLEGGLDHCIPTVPGQCLYIYFPILDESLPPIVLASVRLMVGAAVMWLTAATGLLPMAFSTADTRLGPWITPWWVSLAGLIVLATVLAYVSGIMAARALGSKVASFVSLTEVLFAVIWAWLLLGELPGAIQLLGGVLIVGGVILVRLDEIRGDAGTAAARKVAALDHANDVEPVP